MADSEYFVDDKAVPNESLGKFIFDSLKRREVNEIVNVDAVTGNVLTCGELLQSSIKATAVLKNLGVNRGDIVTIISENTINYCVPVLAGLYMGVTLHPLNPGYAIGELKHTLGICKPKLILCSELALSNILRVKEEVEFIETIVVMGPRSDKHKELPTFENLLKITQTDVESFEPDTFDGSEQGAFVFSSSGTTGLPKGVLLTHKSSKTCIGYLRELKYGAVTSEDITVLVLPLFHIFGLWIQIVGIAFSMKVILLNKFKPDVFLRAIQDYKATKLFAVPPLLLFLAKSALIDDYDISSLRDIMVASAPLGKDLQTEATKRLRGTTVRQLYGITETSGVCTYQPFEATKPGSIGIFIPSLMVMVWDADLKKKVGPLQTGEICLKGPTIMKGYFGNTAATEECFDKEGYYHTGDLGYFDRDGHFYIVDRIKEVIKYKGFQVPPAELEALILTHPGVKDCGVIGIPDERAGQVPLAYVVRKDDTIVTEQNIVDYVAARISLQKHLYGGVVFIEEIPINPSGKLLRRKLLEIYNNSLGK